MRARVVARTIGVQSEFLSMCKLFPKSKRNKEVTTFTNEPPICSPGKRVVILLFDI